MKQQHPTPLAAAVVLLVLLSISNLVTPVLPASQVPPLPIEIAGVVTGLIGLLAAAGLWTGKRWAFWLTLIISALNALGAAPGIPGAPTLFLQIASAVTLVGSIAIIVLLFRPTTRRALRPAASS